VAGFGRATTLIAACTRTIEAEGIEWQAYYRRRQAYTCPRAVPTADVDFLGCA